MYGTWNVYFFLLKFPILHELALMEFCFDRPHLSTHNCTPLPPGALGWHLLYDTGMRKPSYPPPTSSNETGEVGNRQIWNANASPAGTRWFYTLIYLCTGTLLTCSLHLTRNHA